MKKRVMLITLVLVSALVTGCGSSAADTSEAVTAQDNEQITEEESKPEEADKEAKEQGAVEEKSDESDEKPVGMANPIVEISSDVEYVSELDMELDTSWFSDEVSRSIINKEIAQAIFYVTNVNGETVECCFRATRNANLAVDVVENLAGIYSSDISAPVAIDMPIDNGDTIIFRTYHDNEGCYDIASWNYEKVYYTLTTGENMSQMQLGAIYDAALMVIGANRPMVDLTGRVIEPLMPEIELKDDISGTFYVTLESLGATDDGTLVGDFSIYTMDLYDAVDITTMVPGDVLILEDEEIVVQTVTEDAPLELSYRAAEGAAANYTVNGGLIEGGADFIAYDGGTFRYFGLDDMATYSCQGTISLPIDGNAVIVDHLHDFDGEDRSEEGISIKTSDFLDYYNDEYEGSFRYNSTSIRVENGVVVELTRVFVP